MSLTVIVLAAGHGKRMRSKLPKPLHTIGGRSMLGHVLTAIDALEPTEVVVVVGHGRDAVTEHLAEIAPDVVIAVQEEQLGTGHAAAVGLAAAQTEGGDVLVLTADTPLLQAETLAALVAEHRGLGGAMTVLTAGVDAPTGYGRIVRDSGGNVARIVEEKDASDAERAIAEINSGILLFSAEFLATALPRLSQANSSGEYYLTDTVDLARQDGRTVGAHLMADSRQAEGANDRAQLAELGAELNARIVRRHQLAGVTVTDPTSTWIDADVEIAEDVTILPGCHLQGATSIAEDALIGPFTTLLDCEVAQGAEVVRTHATLAVIGEFATVGPFSYLRPGTTLGTSSKIGAFVEAKNAQLGNGAKVPHLSYVGDAEIGDGSNIGAGTIFANYDGVNKHRTMVGAHVRSGSNVTFVAPVTVGDGASTGAGTVVREDVPAGGLALSAGPQRVIEGWAQAKRPGTQQAEAAAAASDES